MIRLFARHKVKSYTDWKKGYDAFDAKRRTLGVRDDAVFRGATDPNDVTIWHDFDSLAAAQAFADSPELLKAMKGAGVLGKPDIWFADRELSA